MKRSGLLVVNLREAESRVWALPVCVGCLCVSTLGVYPCFCGQTVTVSAYIVRQTHRQENSG